MLQYHSKGLRGKLSFGGRRNPRIIANLLPEWSPEHLYRLDIQFLRCM